MLVLTYLFYFVMLLFGVILSISADSWFVCWCGLELNLLSFVPLVCFGSSRYSTEAIMKYFLIQALGSSFVVLGSLGLFFNNIPVIYMSLALLFKLGASPFHFWFIQVMEGLSWPGCFLLMSVQKISPMILISYIVSDVMYIIYWCLLCSIVVGSIGGYNQVLLRSLLAFSSVSHMAWMLGALSIGILYWFVYFCFYFFISFSVVYMFYSYQFFHMSQLVLFDSPLWKVVLFMSLFSLGGLPPFTGFLPKWFVLQELVFSGGWIFIFFLLVGSLITLYYYLRVMLFGYVVGFPIGKWYLGFSGGIGAFVLSVVINFLGLFVCSFFI